MSFVDAIATRPLILTEGSLVERLRRDPQVKVDPLVIHAGFLFEARGRELLEALYRDYMEIGREFDLPMVVGAPTWRANPERLKAAACPSCQEVHQEAARFVSHIRASYGPYSRKIYVAGLMACKGDAYDPSEALEADEAARFHEKQVQALASSGMDFILAATLPALSEARGMARALAGTGIPYVMSFVLRPSGVLLDQTPLEEAMERIDAEVEHRPLCYFSNCVHPDVFSDAMERALERSPGLADRLIGLQANTSPLPPEELDNQESLKTADPEEFAMRMIKVYKKFGTRILGGCCGTGVEHIRAVAAAYGSLQKGQ